MRRFLLIFAWVSLIGSVADGLILVHAVFVIVGDSDWQMSVLQHVVDHLPFFYWVIELAYAILPDGLVTFFVRWPAVAYYPLRIIVNTLLGIWALRVARRMEVRDE